VTHSRHPVIPTLFIESRSDPGGKFLNALFYEAVSKGVADVHIQSEEAHTTILFRIAGQLRKIPEISTNPELISHFDDDSRISADLYSHIQKPLFAKCQINPANLHRALDGRISLKWEDHMIDVRVSTIPTVGGNTIVCRLLSQSNLPDFNNIYMSSMVRQCILDIIKSPNGLFLVSGPVASGKTTLLYSILKMLHNGYRNISTIEHPVEFRIAGLRQINVNDHISFHEALKALLRQDIDVVLVGEIRDAETAKIAVEAANTGKLILATTHANTAPMGIARLLDLGVDRYSLANCLRGVTSQKLANGIANPESLMVSPIDEVEAEWMDRHQLYLRPGALPKETEHTDYATQEKFPLIEMIAIDPDVRKAIMSSKGGTEEILNACVNQPQYENLATCGMRLVLDKKVGFKEMLAKVGLESDNPSKLSDGKILLKQGKINPEELFELLELQTQMRQRGLVRTLEQLADQKNNTVEIILEAA